MSSKRVEAPLNVSKAVSDTLSSDAKLQKMMGQIMSPIVIANLLKDGSFATSVVIAALRSDNMELNGLMFERIQQMRAEVEVLIRKARIYLFMMYRPSDNAFDFSGQDEERQQLALLGSTEDDDECIAGLKSDFVTESLMDHLFAKMTEAVPSASTSVRWLVKFRFQR